MAEKFVWAALPEGQRQHLFKVAAKGEHEPVCGFVVSAPEVAPNDQLHKCAKCAHLELVLKLQP
jgi:hypothetical protein